MGRKTNSICLRLKKTNKDYIHCWYGDILYGYNFKNSVKISKILSSILETVDISCPQFSFTGGYKKANLLLCYLQCSAKKKDCEIFNIPIRNKIKQKKKQESTYFNPTILEHKNIYGFFPLKEVSTHISQDSFFGTYLLNIRLNQPYNLFLDHSKNQFSFQKWCLVFPWTKYVPSQTKAERPARFKDYIYKGCLGLNCNRAHIETSKNKRVFVPRATSTSTKEHFTFHFWSLFYNSENFFLYKFRGLTKKPRNLYKKTYIFAPHLQENTHAQNDTLTHSISQNFAQAKNCLQPKTSIKDTYPYVEQNLLNFQKSIVFFETCSLVKTKTLFLGKKPSPAYTYTTENAMLHNSKQNSMANTLHSNLLCTLTLDGHRSMGFAFKEHGHIKEKVPARQEQQFYKYTYKKQKEVLKNACYKYIDSKPKPVIKTHDVEKQNYICNAYNHIKGVWGNVVSINFVKSCNEKASALFLAHYVCYFLERKILFRRIKRQLLLSLLSSKNIKPWGKNSIQKGEDTIFAQNKKHIIGLRISCSGRVGGRSKKAQRSRKETFMWGETGLHVFSNKLDFAQTYAETSFGTVGIQVWVCYK